MIRNVSILLVNEQKLGEFYFTKNQLGMAKALYQEGMYRKAGSFDFETKSSVDAAEEAFDLTNNPSRQYEREKYYGRGRSVSVGDIVEVDGIKFMCASEGWQYLEI